MSFISKTISCHFRVVPWLSWHEYNVSGKWLTLVYEQRSHTYYLIPDTSTSTWRKITANKVCDNKSILPFEIMIKDRVLISSDYVKYCGLERVEENVEKYDVIPDSFLDDLKREGYVFDAHWDITNKCNERCIHCYNINAHNNLRNVKVNELSFEDAKKLVDDLYFIGVFRIVLSGGEVLTKGFFLPLCRYIRQHNMQLIVYTNALAFSESSLESFAGLYPDTVCVSVYGNTRQSHDQVTQVDGSYDKVLRALFFLKEYRIETHVKNTLLTKNYQYWKSTLDKGRTIASKSMINCTIYPSMDNKNLSKYALSESQLIDLALDRDSPIFYGRKIRGACNIFKKTSETPCYNSTNNIYVNPAGEVCLCIAFPCAVASVKEDNIKKIKRVSPPKSFQNDFTHLNYIDRLDNWRALKIADLKDCGHHDYCEFCIDVCPGDAFLLTGDLLEAPENHCVIAKARYKACQKDASALAKSSKKNDGER